MNIKNFRDIITDKNTETTLNNITLNEVEQEIRNYMYKKTQMENIEGKDKLESLISLYISENINKWRINSFLNKDGKMDKGKLIQIVIDDLLNFGPLQEVLYDPNITEIQGLGRWIIVVDSKGKSKYLYNALGERAKWGSKDDQLTILNKLFEGDGQLVVNNEFKLVNGRTLQGFRLSVTHSTATSRSERDLENGYCDFTLRKFKDSWIPIEDLIQGGTLSDDMGKLLIFMVGNLSYAIIGATGSGKTTLNRSLLNYIPPMTRTICIQQPTEIDLRKYNDKGELINNRVMWEASEDAKSMKEGEPLKYTNTLNNLMTQTLRNTPKIISINEVRHPDECQSAVLIGQAGHIVNLTFHAEDPKQGCKIFTNKVITVSNQSYEVGLMDTTDTFRFMICQNLLKDGSRRITKISEICGVDPEHPTLPKINDIYKYVVTGRKKNEKGEITEIMGHHEKVGNLSPELREKLSREGILEDDLKILDPDFKSKPKQTYTGNVGETFV